MEVPVVEVFEHITDPGNAAKWTQLRGDRETAAFAMHDPSQASTDELRHYQVRALAHKHGLPHEDFVHALRAGAFAELGLRPHAVLASRSQRAAATRFPLMEEFVASRIKNAGSELPRNVLSTRLLSFGLPRAGNDRERWQRLVDHVYGQVPKEFLVFALRAHGATPDTSKSKRELFNEWHRLPSNDVSATDLLDAWHHSPDYVAKAAKRDVSDLALEALDTHDDALAALVQRTRGDLFSRGVRLALQPAYLRAVLEYYDLDPSGLSDEQLLAYARHLARPRSVAEPRVQDVLARASGPPAAARDARVALLAAGDAEAFSLDEAQARRRLAALSV